MLKPDLVKEAHGLPFIAFLRGWSEGHGGRQTLSVWLQEPLAASRVIKLADAGRQGRMVFLPLLQCTFHTTAVLPTPKARVCSGEQQRCLLTVWEKRITGETRKKRQTRFCPILQLIPRIGEDIFMWPCRAVLCSPTQHAQNSVRSSTQWVEWKWLFLVLAS